MDTNRMFDIKRLAGNEDFYNSVYKRTEKVIETVFYILSYIEDNDRNDFYIKLVTDKSNKVQEESIRTLSFYEHEAKDKLFFFQQTLLALEGVLKIAGASRVISDEIVFSILEEIDLVQRYIRNHFSSNNSNPTVTVTSNKPSVTKPKVRSSSSGVGRIGRVNIPAGDISSDAHLVYSQLVDRSTRIKTVLEAKPEATIKDIAEVITDVSEKTIQRELNSLIDKGEVIRQGERRWSKYSVAN